MKAILTFFAIAFISFGASAQRHMSPELESPQSTIFILDSFYHWGWDTLSLHWNLKDRTLYTTDAHQNITSEVAFVLDSLGKWTYSTQTSHIFDIDDKETNEIVQLWNGAVWENSTQNVYTYDDDDNQLSILFQTWSGVDWTNSFRQVFTFDNNHNQLTRTSQHWTGTDWADGARQVSTYNGNNKITLRLFQNYSGGWNDVSRSLYTYDANGDLDILLYQKWNFNAWNDDYRNLYDFDGHHNRILILEQLALGVNVWEDQDKYEYTFDQYDHITHLIYTHFENNAWSNVYQFNLINDDDQNRATEVFQTWNDGWVNVDSTQTYYTGVLATHDFFDHQPMSILPNPASDFIFVEYHKPIDGIVSIYSVLGNQILRFKSEHEPSFLINVTSLTPGVYYVALQVGNQVLTKGFEKF